MTNNSPSYRGMAHTQCKWRYQGRTLKLIRTDPKTQAVRIHNRYDFIGYNIVFSSFPAVHYICSTHTLLHIGNNNAKATLI